MKSLIPTGKGLQVYEFVKDKKIADVAMTAQWELALQKIETNKADAAGFLKEMETYTSSITDELFQTAIAQNKMPELLCPKCKTQHLIISDKIVKCRDEICCWIQFRNICGIHLSLSDIENLVSDGRTSLIKGMKSKSGKTFNAFIALNEQAGSYFEFCEGKHSK